MRRLRWLALAALAAGWLCLVGWRGVGVSPDSAVYLGTASNLAHGDGLTVPFQGITADRMKLPASDYRRAEPATHAPPLYPSLLAIGPSIGVDALEWARVVSAACFGVSAALLAFVSRRRLGHPLPITASVVALFLLSLDTLEPHLGVLSEPLLIVSALAAVAVATSARRTLATAGVAAAAATMTRYVGAGVAVGAVVVLTARRGVRAAALAALPVVAAVGAWGAFLLAHGTGRRRVGFHPPTTNDWLQGGRTVGAWVLPSRLPTGMLLAVGALAVAAVGLYAVVRSRPTRPVAAVALAFAVFVLVAKTLVQADAPLDRRFLSPLFVLFLLLLGSAAAALASLDRRLAVAVLAIPAAATGLRFATFVTSNNLQYLGYERDSGASRSLAHWMQAQPPDRIVLSDDPGYVWYATGRPVYLLPPEIDPGTRAPLAGRDAYLGEVRSAVASGATVVLTDGARKQRWAAQLDLSRSSVYQTLP